MVEPGTICVALERGARATTIAVNLRVSPEAILMARLRFERRTGMSIARKHKPGRPRKAA